MKKKFLLMLPCIVAVAIATLVGKKSFESNALKTNSILLENVEALSQDGEYDASDCNDGFGKYSFVSAATGKSEMRAHHSGEIGGKDGVDVIYTVTFKQCTANGTTGIQKGANYTYSTEMSNLSYVKCEGWQGHHCSML